MKKRLLNWLYSITAADCKMIAIILALTVFAIVGMMWLTSCSSSRKSTTDAKNDTRVEKSDSGSVSKNNSQQNTQSNWWRESWGFMPGKHDTTSIIHTEKQLQPIYYTKEGGSITIQLQNQNLDSFWAAKSDSLNKNQQKLSDSSKTEVLNIWQIIGIILGAQLLLKFIPTPKITFGNGKTH